MGQRLGQLCEFRDRQRRYRQVSYGPNLDHCFRPESLHGHDAETLRVFTSINLTNASTGTTSTSNPAHRISSA
jgi:hypothetical protein